MSQSFLEQLDARANQSKSLLCIGLDPHTDLLPENTAEAARDLCFRVIDATADLACAFKPNSAFFEAFGAAGIAVLKEVIAHVPTNIPVILDAKRGDIGSTAEAYAHAAFDELGATAITLSPYLGREAILPFVKRSTRGAFILARTTNPSSAEFQTLLVDGRPLYLHVAEQAMTWSDQDNVGLVVGATDLTALAAIRQKLPKAWFLVPGIGAQGGDLEAALDAGLREDGSGLLISVSRSVMSGTAPRHEAIRLWTIINERRQRLVHKSAEHRRIQVLAKALADAGCVQFGSFTLKSGQQSPIYLDLRRLVSYPQQLQTIGRLLVEVLARLPFEHIAAIPYAALPIATAASLAGGYSLVYPRREAKTYGTKAAVEGVFHPNDTAVVVDDLATTGDSKFEAITRLTDAGLLVKDIVVVIDREQGAAETLHSAGYHFHALATLHQLLDAWQQIGVLSADQRREVDAYLKDQRV